MSDENKISASLTNVTLSNEANKMIINGCIAFIDRPTDGAPCGSDGMNMVLTAEAVEACGKTFKDMPVNCVMADDFFDLPQEIFAGHGGSNIGFMRKIKSQEDRIMAEIVIWKDNLPWGFADLILNAVDSLGFSIEMYATRTHDDIPHNIRYVDEFEGVGVALMWSNAAAFSDTFIEKIAAMKAKRGELEMTKEEIEALVKSSIEAAMATQTDKLTEINASIEKLKASAENAEKIGEMSQKVEQIMAEAEATANALKEMDDKITAQAEKIKASVAPVIPEPKTQAPAPNPNVGTPEKSYNEKVAEINASSMSQLDKLKAITKIRVEAMKKG